MKKREIPTTDGETVTQYIPESKEDVEWIRENFGDDALDGPQAFSQQRQGAPEKAESRDKSGEDGG